MVHGRVYVSCQNRAVATKLNQQNAPAVYTSYFSIPPCICALYIKDAANIVFAMVYAHPVNAHRCTISTEGRCTPTRLCIFYFTASNPS
jgi:hypothetical protein